MASSSPSPSSQPARSVSPEIAPFTTEFSGAFASTARPNSALSERTPLVAGSTSADPAAAAAGADGPASPEQRKALEDRAKWIAVGAATASAVAGLIGWWWVRREHHR